MSGNLLYKIELGAKANLAKLQRTDVVDDKCTCTWEFIPLEGDNVHNGQECLGCETRGDGFLAKWMREHEQEDMDMEEFAELGASALVRNNIFANQSNWKAVDEKELPAVLLKDGLSSKRRSFFDAKSSSWILVQPDTIKILTVRKSKGLLQPVNYDVIIEAPAILLEGADILLNSKR